MLFDDFEKEYKLVAPDVDDLLYYFDRNDFNSIQSTPALLEVTDVLWDILDPIAPSKKNNEAKSIWLRIPKGTIEDFGDFEEMKSYGDVKNYDEFIKLWNEVYPEDICWYNLIVIKSFNNDGSLRFYAVGLGNKIVISAFTEKHSLDDGKWFPEEKAVKICNLIVPAVKESINLLKEGKYNEIIEETLPFIFRKGVIRRSDLWEADPEYKKMDYDGLTEEDVKEFKEIINSGVNDPNKIDRIKDFTANDFFQACKTGYIAIGKNCDNFSLPDLYMYYSDGRDEGLTGKGYGLNEGPGIDFSSPSEWEEWYFNRTQQGGHPWEVVPGGNSTHMELYVSNDKNKLKLDLISGEITEEEYEERIKNAGYYFTIAGSHRPFESVKFYIALSKAGYPVIINNAKVLMAVFEGKDYIGIVPHHLFTRYCEDLFPEKYGDIHDFTHVFEEDLEKFGNKIEWLPEDHACLE